jgi:hypothetical protein
MGTKKMTDKFSYRDEMTINDLLDLFDNYRRIKEHGTAIVHLDRNYGFIELKEEFVQALKNDIALKSKIVAAGIDELSPLEKFAIIVLQDSY